MNQKSFARLEARIDPKIKAMCQQAAELQGRSLTDFIVESISKAAIETIQLHQSMKLDREDSKAFVNAITNSPQPNQELIKAFNEYQGKFNP